MSQIYTLEPPTEGKVVITTTHGDIDVELFAREAPLACRNFIQLALEGAYDECAFTRVVRDFMIQTGDPTNTGRGGESVHPSGVFKDEFHSRLKFNARGRVAMANAGRKDTNGSQFFITLAPCAWLDKKHTIFGKCGSSSFYNAMEIGKVEVVGDAPVAPAPRVLKVEVIHNPFDDIVPRRRRGDVDDGADGANVEDFRKTKKAPKKKLNLLSFGEEAAEDEETLERVAPGLKIKSSHDVGGDDTLVSASAEETREVMERTERDRALAKERKDRVRERLRDMGEDDASGDDERARETSGKRAAKGWDDDDENGHDVGGKRQRGDGADAAGFEERMRAKMVAKRRELGDVEGGLKDIERDIKAQADALEEKKAKYALKEKRRAEKAARDDERRAREANKLKKLGLGKKALSREDAALLNDAEVKRIETKARKSRVVDREKETLARLAAFNSKHASVLKSKNASADATPAQDAPEINERAGMVGVSRFVPQGLYYMDDENAENDDDDDSDWRTHKLAFVETKRDMQYSASVDDYEVVDPLLEKGKGKFAKKRS